MKISPDRAGMTQLEKDDIFHKCVIYKSNTKGFDYINKCKQF